MLVKQWAVDLPGSFFFRSVVLKTLFTAQVVEDKASL